MKKLLSMVGRGCRHALIILCLLSSALCPQARAATEITAVVTITNTPAGLPTNIVINIGTASTRNWTNDVTGAPTTSIQITNSTAATATNLVQHLASYPVYSAGTGTPQLGVAYSGTNTSVIWLTAPLDTNITVTFGGNWAYVVYVTNTFTASGPIQSRTNAMSHPARTNSANAIVNLLAAIETTNALPPGLKSMSNYMDRSSSQTFSNKTLSHTRLAEQVSIVNATNITGTNVALTNVVLRLVSLTGADLSGFITALTNGTIWSNVQHYVRITNAVGLHGSVEGLTGGVFTSSTNVTPLILGPQISNANIFGATTVTGSSIAMIGSGVNNLISMTATSTIAAAGAILILERENGITNAVDSGDVLGLIGFRGWGTTGQKIGARIRAIPVETFTDSTAATILLFETSPSGTVQPVGRLHIASDGLVTISNMLQVVVALTNSNFAGTNKWKGDISLDRYANSSIVNGNNAGIPIGTNVVVNLSGGTTIAQYAGFTASRDGDLRMVRMSGAVTNIIVNEVDATWSTDGTAARRIRTGTGASLVLTNQPSYIQMLYNGTDSVWEVLAHSR
jgi:uncharacterized protein YjbI with pentapeptide repeats